MKTIKNKLLGFAFCLATLFAAAPSRAYVVDGLLSDWGVTQFSDWTPNAGSIDWAGGDYENNRGGPGWYPPLGSFGGEPFDAEAMYFDDDQQNIYFAIAMSMPQGGTLHGGTLYRTGDLAIGFNSPYEYGVKLGSAGFGNVVSGGNWVLPNASQGFPVNGYSEATGGTVVGHAAELVYHDTGIYDNGYTNYVVEGRVSKSLLGDYIPAGTDVKLHWTMSCGNDAIDLDGKINNPVPEPATMALMGIGLLCLSLRKKKTHKI